MIRVKGLLNGKIIKLNRYKARTFISNLGKKLITNGQLSDRNRIACHETGRRTAVDVSNREYRAVFDKRFRLRAIILRTVFYLSQFNRK
jgi:hypothetical protein